MKFRVEVICVNDKGAEQRRDVMEVKRDELAMENLGLSLGEGKALLQGVQDFVAPQQVSEDLQRRTTARTAVSGTTAKQRGRARWRRYSGQSWCDQSRATLWMAAMSGRHIREAFSR
jgi:hypothetical protein